MRRNWLAVARKDVADASRSWLLYVLTGLLVATFGVLVIGEGLTYEPPAQPPDGPEPPETPFVGLALRNLLRYGGLLVPLVALVVGYLAVAGEREAGSLRLLLGQPVTRRDVVVGKFLGRTAIVWMAVLVALAVAGLGIPELYRGFDAVVYAGFVGLVLLMATGFVAVAVGISAAARSRALSMAGAITTFVGTVFAWDALPLGLHYLLHGTTPTRGIGPDPAPAWFILLRRLRPQEAFDIVWRTFVRPGLEAIERPDNVGRFVPESGEPFYTEPWFSVVVLVAWMVVPLALGYWRFDGADVG